MWISKTQNRIEVSRPWARHQGISHGSVVIFPVVLVVVTAAAIRLFTPAGVTPALSGSGRLGCRRGSRLILLLRTTPPPSLFGCTSKWMRSAAPVRPQHQHIFTFSGDAFESEGWGAECASPSRPSRLQHRGAVRYMPRRRSAISTFFNVP